MGKKEGSKVSQKLLRIFTTVLTGLLTLAILIGATYVYQKLVYTNPLEASVKQLTAVSSFEIEKGKAYSRIHVQFRVTEKLRTSFYQLLDQLESQSAKDLQNLVLVIDNQPQDNLEQFLHQAQLPIQEAISTGLFTMLPQKLQEVGESTGVTFDLEIDNTFVFITANYGGQSAHLIVNRGNSPLSIVNSMGGEYL